MFVIQGTGLYSIGSQLYRYRPGAVLILPPHIEHAAGHPPDIRSFTHIWISVPHDIFVNLYVRRQGSLSLTFRRNWFFPLKETGLGRIIYDGVPQTPDDGRRLRLLAVLCEVIGKLLAPTQASTGEPTGARQFQKIEAVCRHIEETGGKGLCLTELARLSGISKFHLLRVFKRQVGCTVHQFINRHRLQTMNRLIEKGTPRKVIAQELGFSCPAAFSRWAAATSLFK